MKTVQEVTDYVAARLAFNGVGYRIYFAGTGSVYFKIGGRKLRIADHSGVWDNYRYVIRLDCKAPSPLKGKIVVPSALADIAIDAAITEYCPESDEETMLQKIAITKRWTKDQAKKINMGLLLKIIQFDPKSGPIPTKVHCLNIIAQNPGLVWDFFDNDFFDLINTEK